MNEQNPPDANVSPETRINPAYEKQELRRALIRPHAIVHLVLTDRGRLTATLAQQKNLGLLAAALFGFGVLYALPYWMALEPEGTWKTPVLFFGSMLICFPSLYVFSAYLGFRNGLLQSFVLALVIPCVAGLFAFGFFPIFWFLEVTMTHQVPETALPGVLKTLRVIAGLFLASSLLAGIAHMWRCMKGESQLWSLSPMILFWQILLIFISYRMAMFLGMVI